VGEEGNVRIYGEEERGRRIATGQEQNDMCTYNV
jgi:hypothetical protein